MTTLGKLKLMAIGGFAAGTVSSIFAVLFPTTFEPSALVNQSQKTTALNEKNADAWTQIPGNNDI
jgi:hypothetical protein